MEKSLNDILAQFVRLKNHEKRKEHDFFMLHRAFRNTLKKRFRIDGPRDAKKFIKQYGKDFKM